MRFKLHTHLKALIASLCAFFPTPLPRSDAEFKTWAGAIMRLGGYEEGNASIAMALASQLQMLPERTVRKPKRFFVRSIQNAVIRQVAFYAISDAREALKAKEANEPQE